MPRPPKQVLSVIIDQKTNTVKTSIDVNVLQSMNDVQKSQIFAMLQTALSAISGHEIAIRVIPNEYEAEDYRSEHTYPDVAQNIQQPMQEVPAQNNRTSADIPNKRNRKSGKSSPRPAGESLPDLQEDGEA